MAERGGFMRRIQRVLVAVSLFVALAGNAVAAPGGSRGDDPLTAIRKLVVKILDDVAAKIGLPPG
jgi:hypothetical protein